ncbi:hypothetical protein CSUB01_07951 [Colletotrichum sublineola]|uniref:Uncharacterized protein n=1 Tax=Colletotrichum sublineola TaxID=1173701 RepID=A0A066XXK3_COLSU|nr:hypothetical protein CSUB01_07951 [Colletotrichum sublineola]
MPPRKSADEFFRRGREKGSEQCKEGINDSVVLKQPTDKSLKGYRRMVSLWNQYAIHHADVNPSPYDLKYLKDFIKDIAFSIDGAEGDPNPAAGTVMVYWKQFTAGWRREHDPIPGNTTLSVRNGLQESSLKLVTTKRQRRFGTKNHFFHLGRQLWGNDWVEYEKPGTRVYDWAALMSIVCSAARIGEYIESTSRSNSGRGLYYKVSNEDVTFGVFRNEHGNAEFAIQLVRDAKGMTHTPDKRPQHSLYEGLGQMPLICNPMLPILAILVAEKAFKDYSTLAELLAIEPADDEMRQLRWNDSILDQPFFKSTSSKRTTRKIETANAFGRRLRALGFRAGYPRPPTVHDFRAEGLYWIDKLYTVAQRMKHAGQRDPNTFNNHYQPNNSGTDGQGSYFGHDVRSVVNDLFRGLTLERNSQLSQSLPAEKQEALRTDPGFAAIEKELATLLGRRYLVSSSRRKKLYIQKRDLVEQELRKWQMAQPNHPTGEDSAMPCYHRSIFNQVRFLMPARDRLASTLLETATLRSSTGLSVIEDMISLCKADAEVEYRPGLEPQKCQCDGSRSRRRKSPGTIQSNLNQQSPYDWRHVYNCFKKNSNVFTELCFLCNNWISGEANWSEHCQQHLTRPETLPVQCDPLIYGGVLATAGYCVFCMSDSSLEPEARLRHFLDRGSWKAHVQSHYETYVQSVDGGERMKCPHPGKHCSAPFDSVEHLKFHLLDAHCRDFTKESNILEELAQNDEISIEELLKQEESTLCKKQRRGVKERLENVKVEAMF